MANKKRIKKEDILELHETIKAIELRQESALEYVFHAMKELKEVGAMLGVLRKEYEKLKDKAAE